MDPKPAAAQELGLSERFDAWLKTPGRPSQLLGYGFLTFIVLSCLGCCLLLSIGSSADQGNLASGQLVGLLTCLALFFGIILLILVIIFRTPEILRRQQVVDRWDTLIISGAGRGQQVLDATYIHLEELQPPNLDLRSNDLTPGLLRGALGETRPFITIRQTHNVRIGLYRMQLNVRDYGTSLQASWFLTVHPTLWQRFLWRLGAMEIDLFDEQDLRASVTAVHHCFIEAIIDLLNDLGQDTHINRTSKGFLGVS